MQRLLYSLTAILIGVLEVSVHAELIILRNGDRIDGEIVEQTAESVSVRRAFKDSKITYVEEIKRSRIARIEAATDGQNQATSRPAEPSPATAPDIERSEAVRAAPLTEAERTELLASAADRWKTGDYGTAGIVLARLINSSDADELAAMSAQIERKTEMSLADLAAETHLRAALERANGRAVRLLYVTDYEKPSLVPRLVETYEDALKGHIHLATDSKARPGSRARVQPRRGTTASGPEREDDDDDDRDDDRNSGNDSREDDRDDDDRMSGGAGPAPIPAIGEWLEQPESFSGSAEEARAAIGPISHAMSLLAERMRLDPAIRANPKLRTELTKERTRLVALNKVVAARAGTVAVQERADRTAERRDRETEQRRLRQAGPRDENEEHEAELHGMLEKIGREMEEDGTGEIRGDDRQPDERRGPRREPQHAPEEKERENDHENEGEQRSPLLSCVHGRL